MSTAIFVADMAGDGVLACRSQDGRNKLTSGDGVKGHEDGIHGALILISSRSILDDHVELNFVGSPRVQHSPFN